MSVDRDGGLGARAEIDVAAVVESVVGCKWSVQLLRLIAEGTQRPGRLQASCPGLSTKVMNERLRKLVRLGLLQRTEQAEIPPRVDYTLTPFGRRFGVLLDEVARLQDELERGDLDEA